MRVFRCRFPSIARRAAAVLCVLTLLSSALVFGTRAEETRQRLTEEQRILHVLNRLGFGARPGDVERVRAMGVERYVEQQLHPEKIDDSVAESKLKDLTALQLPTSELFAKYPRPGALLRRLERGGDVPPELAPVLEARKRAQEEGAAEEKGTKPEEMDARPRNTEARRALRDYLLKNGMRPPQQLTAELQASRILRAVYSERQLQEVLVDFWTNHFNVFAGKGADRWFLISYDRDTIRPRTLGKFYDLLKATAESPAMLFYLDNFQSVSPNGGTARRNRGGGLFGMMTGQESETARPEQQQQQRRRRGINENYARELMELHTLGVDGGYTQQDVQEVARCFTGWTIRAPRGYRNAAGGVVDEQAGQFHFNPRLHDDGEKVVLGHKIPAGGGVRDGLMVLEILARHPSTAKFIATKLARRFVTDDPSPALVNRAAAAFTRSDGDIRETLRALLTSPEFNSAESYRAKIKTPFELAVSSVRALGGETNGGPALHQWIARMGEPLYMYQAPTGYPDAAGNWVNTGALLERLNFGLALASNRIQGTRVDLARFAGDAKVSEANLERVTARFLEVVVHGDVSPKTKATLLKQLSEPLPETPQTQATGATDDDEMPAAGRRRRQQARAAAVDLARVSDPELVKVVGLILGSPEFQRQ